MSVVALIALFFGLMATGMPIAFVILACGILFVMLDPSIIDLGYVQTLIMATQPFPLITIPLFILAGELMNLSGITRRLMNLASALTGHMVGGIAQVNIVLSLLKGGMCGSANADAAMDAKMLVPEMARRGYSVAFGSVVTATSGLISGLIPPSLSLLLFGFVTNTSVGALFMAGILPGLLLTALQMGATYGVSRHRGYGGDAVPADWSTIRRAFIASLPALLMPAMITLGIRFGVFTPSEAGAAAVVYALVFCLVYREARWRELVEALKGTASATSAIMVILAASAALSWSLTYERVPQKVAEWLIGITADPQALLLLISTFLFVAGMFIEGTAMILILAPMFLPAVKAAGIDPVHFGVVFVYVALIGGVTPPVGTVMFTTCSITGTKIPDFFRESLWFLAAMLAGAIVIIFVPSTATFLAYL